MLTLNRLIQANHSTLVTLSYTKFTGLERKLGLRMKIYNKHTTTYHGPTLLRQSSSLAEVSIHVDLFHMNRFLISLLPPFWKILYYILSVGLHAETTDIDCVKSLKILLSSHSLPYFPSPAKIPIRKKAFQNVACSRLSVNGAYRMWLGDVRRAGSTPLIESLEQAIQNVT